ncbi:hypothetical protein AVEN_72919-1 [Araneus ventricosus]|uniref:Uncharacterized protein n=1 Tax=Araneus ventricosus TaxID=182803 RepID=A0A4Y2GYJ6_ARAVE|nr:hypothetical protein AVEN_72919-1 [Araneus ventricosus]
MQTTEIALLTKELPPPFQRIRKNLIDSRPDVNRKMRVEFYSPLPSTAQSFPQEIEVDSGVVVTQPHVIIIPIRKRDPVYLFGGLSSTFLWCRGQQRAITQNMWLNHENIQ